jgi:hypothetical protein
VFEQAGILAFTSWYLAVVNPLPKDTPLKTMDVWIHVLNLSCCGAIFVLGCIEIIMDVVSVLCSLCTDGSFTTVQTLGMWSVLTSERDKLRWACLPWIGVILNMVVAFANRKAIFLLWIAQWHITALIILFPQAAWCYTRLTAVDGKAYSSRRDDVWWNESVEVEVEEEKVSVT